jgi:hypothetical protein
LPVGRFVGRSSRHLILGWPAHKSDGTLDASGGDGVLRTSFAHTDKLFSLALQADAKILAAGFAGGQSGRDFALARYKLGGRLDPTAANRLQQWRGRRGPRRPHPGERTHCTRGRRRLRSLCSRPLSGRWKARSELQRRREAAHDGSVRETAQAARDLRCSPASGRPHRRGGPGISSFERLGRRASSLLDFVGQGSAEQPSERRRGPYSSLSMT